MAKRKPKLKLTLNEFKAWLQGIEELQSDAWTPNTEQWKLIREKIKNIIEEPNNTQSLGGLQPKFPGTVFNQNASNLTAVPTQIPGFVPPPLTGGIPGGEVIGMTDAAKNLLKPGPDGKFKTPHTDGSNGKTSSPFE